MEQIEQAHYEIEHLQKIIARHEGHMFVLRSWLLAIIGGLLAAYYTSNIAIDDWLLRGGLVAIVVLFLFIELQHLNVIDAVVERVRAVEAQITATREAPNGPDAYDGPRISEACEDGAGRVLPRRGMTLMLNQPFYVAVIVAILLTTVALPARLEAHGDAGDGASAGTAEADCMPKALEITRSGGFVRSTGAL